MCNGCLYWSDVFPSRFASYIQAMPHSIGHSHLHAKSIEGYAGKVSVHRMACHFNSPHFLEQVSGELEQDDRIPTGGPSSPQFSCAVKRARVQKIYYDSGRKLKGLIDVAWPRSD